MDYEEGASVEVCVMSKKNKGHDHEPVAGVGVAEKYSPEKKKIKLRKGRLARAVDLFHLANVRNAACQRGFLRARGGVGVYCAKLNRANNKRRIFRHRSSTCRALHVQGREVRL